MSSSKIGFKGHPYSSEDEGVKIVTVEYKGKAKYSMSAGQAISRFLKELRLGRIVGRKCRKCGRVLIPPRMYCENCFRPTDEWVYVRPIGIVKTAAVSYIAATRERLKEPEVIGVIEFLDAPGSGIFHRLKVKPEDVVSRKVFGLKVRAVWKPENERVGSINDILYFEPFERGD